MSARSASQLGGRRHRLAISAVVVGLLGAAALVGVQLPPTAAHAAATSSAQPHTASSDDSLTAKPTTFHPIGPTRFLDTRSAIGAPGPLGPNGTVMVPLPGQSFPQLANATAVVVNVTVTQPTAGGFVVVYNGSTAQPTTSNLNFSRGETVANLVTTNFDRQRTLAFHSGSSGTVQLIADLVGYYTPDRTGWSFSPVAPERVVDTRSGIGVAKGT